MSNEFPQSCGGELVGAEERWPADCISRVPRAGKVVNLVGHLLDPHPAPWGDAALPARLGDPRQRQRVGEHGERLRACREVRGRALHSFKDCARFVVECWCVLAVPRVRCRPVVDQNELPVIVILA